MKRVVAFFDMFDEIPENAHYLFSRKAESPFPATPKEKESAKEGATETPEATPSAEPIIYIHYYEVDDMDFENLMEAESPFLKDSNLEKMKKFMHKYKIPTH